MAPMNRSITVTLVAGCLMTIFLIFTACDAINLEASKITELEGRIAQLEEQIDHWEKANTRLQDEKMAAINQYNDLVTINRGLISVRNSLIYENVELKAKIAELTGTERQAKKVKIQKFTIKFNNGEFYNNAASRAVAKKVIDIIKANPVSKITVAGYSSHNGPASLNMKVSKARAEGVIDKIHEAHNNGPLHIDMVAYGEGSDNERKVVITVETIT